MTGAGVKYTGESRRLRGKALVDLVGRLSNHEVTTLLQRLTSRDWKQVFREQPPARGVAPDGRRKFGSVRDAILTVLAQAGGELRARDVHEGVEELLGESVSSSSVRNCLRRGCRRGTPLFDGDRRGYRLSR